MEVDSETTVDPDSHERLLRSVSEKRSKKKQRKSLRGGPVVKNVSEFSAASTGEKVEASELLSSFSTLADYQEVGKQIHLTKKNAKLVKPPLHRQATEQIARRAAYSKSRSLVSEWSEIVRQNRLADQLSFPLVQAAGSSRNIEQVTRGSEPRTPLEIETAKILESSKDVLSNKAELTESEREIVAAMSLREARARRAEIQKMRALISYQEAKMKRQKKIKSKNYHRMLKKQERKKVQKEFEQLREVDPEAALEKLETLEKDRALERVTLKHRNTGKWAKRMKMFAKHDPQAKEALQEQVRLHQELKEKMAKANSDSESESSADELAIDDVIDDVINESSDVTFVDNPWMKRQLNALDTAKPVSKAAFEALTGTREMVPLEPWNVPGSSTDPVPGIDGTEISDDPVPAIDVTGSSTDPVTGSEIALEVKEATVPISTRSKSRSKTKRKVQPEKVPAPSVVDPSTSGNDEKASEQKVSDPETVATPKQERKRRRKAKSSNAEKESGNTEKKSRNTEKSPDLNALFDQAIAAEESRDVSDTELLDPAVRRHKPKRPKRNAEPKLVEPTEPDLHQADKNDKKMEPMIDPDDFLRRPGKSVPGMLPSAEVEHEGDGINFESQAALIAEAFADDEGLIDDFSAEKGDIEDKDKPMDVDNFLPGWGDWTGPGISENTEKRARYTQKPPPGPDRKDKGLPGVIISETADLAMQKHRVSEVPFPFVSVRAFEESMKQPVGREWNSQLVHKRMTEPAVTVKAGRPIDPMQKALKGKSGVVYDSDSESD